MVTTIGIGLKVLEGGRNPVILVNQLAIVDRKGQGMFQGTKGYRKVDCGVRSEENIDCSALNGREYRTRGVRKVGVAMVTGWNNRGRVFWCAVGEKGSLR